MTIEGRKHKAVSVQGASRSIHNTLSQCDVTSFPTKKNRIPGQMNRTSSSRPPTTETKCNFAFSIFCHKGV